MGNKPGPSQQFPGSDAVGGGGAGAGRAIGDRAGGAVTGGEGVEVFKQARARA